mmetsp:Transcript_36981/g.67847  ORF Transcript_36981/g.67847 Transcript_36981/m.67847 type:complete len:543 (+) Transcript_36981:128-1756(+)|eukprot:CAMPEP_0201898920 /NCGR_PEP_ID=MMETSP0902-20130614/49414_1 /ASSEMBLY_ACC=CAM_ASM_000551 /TAXON_ID=420261 /ORGANISM="Thalassiosira antarctica, Strain CCMP982" /LENGTH=542 /DNA_ID=CAMNT_0048432193 /DNA_START=29 /DNA_END=1657 /DNA_ORIENTATION=-
MPRTGKVVTTLTILARRVALLCLFYAIDAKAFAPCYHGGINAAACLQRKKNHSLSFSISNTDSSKSKESTTENADELRPPPKSSHFRPPIAPVSFGQALKGINGKESMHFLLEMAEKTKSDTFQLFGKPFPKLYIVGNVHTARDILLEKSTSKVPHIYKTYDKIMGKRTMLTTVDNEDFKKMKDSLIKPVFHQSAVVKSMNRNFEEYAKDWVDNKLETFSETGQLFDPTEEMGCLFFCSYLDSAFEFNATDEDYCNFTRNFETALPELIYKRGISPLRKYHDFMYPKTREAFKSCKALQAYGEEILRSYRKKKVEDRSETATLIKVIADEKAPFKNDKYRVAQIVDLIVASHVTTARHVSSTMVLMAKHPDVASKLQKELAGTNSTPRSHQSNLGNMMKESYRLCPPGATLTSLHTTGRDFHVYDALNKSKLGMIVPKGSTVLIPNILMCRNPGIFPNPDVFVPERWTNANKDMEDSLLVFSLGNRRCPGQSLASVQTSFILEMILSRYSFEIEKEGYFQFNGLISGFSGTRLCAKKAINLL